MEEISPTLIIRHLQMLRNSILSAIVFVPLLFSGLVILTGCEKGYDSPVYHPVPDSVTDIDGYIYHTVKIGTQAWLVENLKTIHYRNGDPVNTSNGPSIWGTDKTGASCAYNNDESSVETYGRLYNWYAANDARNLCPSGWHIPAEPEWKMLMDYLGGELAAGGELKSTGSAYWYAPNTDATNNSGFTALPSGYRNDTGVFANRRFSAIFWSSTQLDSTHAWYRYLYANYGGMYKDNYHNKSHGFSIRCIMDN